MKFGGEKVSRKSKSNEGESKTRHISVVFPIITVIILGAIGLVASFKKWKGLRSSLQEDLQSLLEQQTQQAQKDLHMLADKQDQQIAALHMLAEEFTRSPEEADPNWHRVTLFSDGVFAVAITLLVLDIHTPVRLYGLTSLLQNILIFTYTFLYIGFFWNLHRQIFRYIKRINTRIVREAKK
jgi:Endosomal/lysosomal potassium channel TMEM175